MQKRLVVVCLLNFLVAALMGLTLRYFFVNPVSFNFRFLTHAHSHVAMLGWVYLMLYVWFVQHFIPDKKPIYNRLFWMTEIAVIGMMVSFPFQGYAAISISFSILHIFCSYYFIYLIWKNHRVESLAARSLMKASLVLMGISTIGVWCLGPAVSILGPTSAFYQIAIQFFLHFQFNGWFLLAVLAIFLHQFQIKDDALFKRFFKLLVIATILTFALPVSWFAYHPILLWINGIGVLLQLVSLYYFIKLIQPYWFSFFSNASNLVKLLYRFALFCFVLKIVLQALSILPEVSTMAYQYHNFVIGFIHLTMLGVISGFLFTFLLQSSLTSYKSNLLTFGMYSFMIGFCATEILLFIQGWFYYFGIGLIPNYYLILFLFSILLPFGILFLIYNILKNDSKTIKTT